jgi:hypothetical protein|tara:strand:- start:7304 stop:7783 length:480 start_codon:yes stop_codon:yes gene_type:complete
MTISNSNILTNIRRQGMSSGGFRNPRTGSKLGKRDKLPPPIPATVHKRIHDAKIDTKQYEKMLLFARNANWLAGQRKLKLNENELSSLVVYPTNGDAPMTNRSGMRGGGLVSLTTRDNNKTKPLSRNNPSITIKNTNRLPIQPNYSAFKNNFKLRSNKH